MSAVGVGLQVSLGVIEILKAYNVFKAQNPGMTEDEALQAFGAQVGSFNASVDRWDNAEPPSA